jgi:hypothetical protein
MSRACNVSAAGATLTTRMRANGALEIKTILYTAVLFSHGTGKVRKLGTEFLAHAVFPAPDGATLRFGNTLASAEKAKGGAKPCDTTRLIQNSPNLCGPRRSSKVPRRQSCALAVVGTSAIEVATTVATARRIDLIMGSPI